MKLLHVIIVMFILSMFASGRKARIGLNNRLPIRHSGSIIFIPGQKGEERISVGQNVLEGEWPGSLTNLIDTLNLGGIFFPNYRCCQQPDDLFAGIQLVVQ